MKHELTDPDYCIVLNEVGGNINQKGDGHIRGETFLHEDGMVPQIQCSRNDRHFTLLGLTLLSGLPLMCVVIFAVKRDNPVLETSVDPFAEEVGSQNDADYMIKYRERQIISFRTYL